MTRRDDVLATLAAVCEHTDRPTINVWTPQGWKAPKGFPRRELVCCPSAGGKTWSVNREKLLAWVVAQTRAELEGEHA